jgi:hypothetical protein
MRVESRARVRFVGPTAEERELESSVGWSATLRQLWVSRKQGLCFRKESIVLFVVRIGGSEGRRDLPWSLLLL